MESYSCKNAGNYKKLYKQQLSHQEGGLGLQALSPSQTFLGSPLPTCMAGSPTSPPQPGELCDAVSSKTLFFLRSTLTEAFQPDYDFTNAKSEEFSREPSVKWVMEAVRSNLFAAAGETFVNFEPKLWATIDEEIKLSECDIYRLDALSTPLYNWGGPCNIS